MTVLSRKTPLVEFEITGSRVMGCASSLDARIRVRRWIVLPDPSGRCGWFLVQRKEIIPLLALSNDEVHRLERMLGVESRFVVNFSD